MNSPNVLISLQENIWKGSIPIQVKLSPSESRSYDDTDPYIIQVPRLSYLPFLLPRMHDFFSSSMIDPDISPHVGWFSFEDVPLKWQHPVGLLYDIFSGAEPSVPNPDGSAPARELGQDKLLPWKITIHFTEWPVDQLIPLDADFKIQHDVFINSVKEADFLRNGTAKAIMSLSKDDSTKLWQSVQENDLRLFNSVNQKLLNPSSGPIRHIPMKVYLGTTATDPSPAETPSQGTLRVVQSLVTPTTATREPQTIGNALHSILPTVFPSRRSPIHANAVLHGAAVPLTAPAHDLMRAAAYADGFLHIAVIMVS